MTADILIANGTNWLSMLTGDTISVGVEPVGSNPYFSHIDRRDRGTGTGYQPFDNILKTAVGTSEQVGTFIHEYSGNSHPTTFASSAVSTAQGLGIGAMLNTKLDWAGLANGDYDSLIAGFYNSWPVEVFGVVTVNHEPENDGPSPAKPSDSTYVSWANTNAPIWKNGLNRYINVAAPIIRARGLNVRVGGCLMDFSWDTTRYTWWNWWDEINPANVNEIDFGIDAYVKTVDATPPYGYDLIPRIQECAAEARSVGIKSVSLYETAVDRRKRNGGETLVGTDASVGAWWPQYVAGLKGIPEIHMVCYFHLPAGPASAQAYLNGSAHYEMFGQICMNGRRPGE